MLIAGTLNTFSLSQQLSWYKIWWTSIAILYETF